MDIKAVIQFIKKLPAEEISLETAVREFHYHPAYLSRKFTEATGDSFRKYVESLKIHRGQAPASGGSKLGDGDFRGILL